MHQFKLSLILLIASSLQSCKSDKLQELKVAQAEVLAENKILKDSIADLQERLHQYKYIYGFKSIKPMIIPKELNLIKGEASEFYLLVAGGQFNRGGKEYQANYKLEANSKNEMKWQSESGMDILSYRPLSSGKDTIKVEFLFQDPDSLESMRFPIEYPVEIRKKSKRCESGR